MRKPDTVHYYIHPSVIISVSPCFDCQFMSSIQESSTSVIRINSRLHKIVVIIIYYKTSNRAINLSAGIVYNRHLKIMLLLAVYRNLDGLALVAQFCVVRLQTWKAYALAKKLKSSYFREFNLEI